MQDLPIQLKSKSIATYDANMPPGDSLIHRKKPRIERRLPFSVSPSNV
jgi:hypothetical protein